MVEVEQHYAPKTAEDVLRERQAADAAARDAEARQQAAEAKRQAYLETERRKELRAQIITERRAALKRLTAAGFPGGTLETIVTGYYPVYYGLRGKKYYHEQTTVQRASWELPLLSGCIRYYYVSDGELYAHREAGDSYRGRQGEVLEGLHFFSLEHLESLTLENILKALQALGAAA